jgi:hypothetical protein
MNEILAEVSTAKWWFTTIVVAISINLASSYLKSYADSFLGLISKKYAARLQYRRGKVTNEVAELVHDPEACIDYMAQEMAHRMRAIIWGIAAVFSLILYLSFKMTALMSPTARESEFWIRASLAIASGPFLLFGLREYMEASRRRGVLLLVYKERGHHVPKTGI